ncbi:MAG: homocysteine biosynthesis protein [Clostridia bacterium]|nr:homocysteine biosynthesis protein [Clostridia bacterium]MDD4048187.1 homocysteine biosynthesis protein [Clostridia bacterium]
MIVERTYKEINERIKAGKAVVLTAEEVIGKVKEKGIIQTAKEVDVVTTGTFGPMCSSGLFLNFGHTKPRMRMSKVWLNEIPAYAGIAAVDAFLGATELSEQDPCNTNYPGEFRYGGGHVIEDLVARKTVKLRATSYGTDCYPRREYEKDITLDSINEAILFNPRNCYQNYSCAINTTEKTIHTYMGTLKPHIGNASYSTSGQLSPLLKDPYFKTIGVGTRIFLGGGTGYVVWNGTQHFPGFLKDKESGKLTGAGGTLAVLGDLKQMNARWLRGVSMRGYGASLAVGIGLPIPILNEEVLEYAAKSDEELYAPIVDYGDAYPNLRSEDLGCASYAQLKKGSIKVKGKDVPATPMSSYPRAVEIAGTLKKWIQKGDFLLGEPTQLLPGPGENDC